MLPLLPVSLLLKVIGKTSDFFLKKGFEGEIDAPNAGVMKI